MATNTSRSMNADLKLGMRDGTFKSLTPNRGGKVETKDAVERSNQLQLQYNMFTESHPMDCPCAACTYGLY